MKVSIWGAGKFGQYIKKQLEKREDIVLMSFIDSNIGEGYFDDLPVLSLAQARRQKVDLILIAILDYTSVFDQLKNEDVSGIGIIKGNVRVISGNIYEDENIIWMTEIEIHKPVLKHLETNIMDGCNLNCKGCSHFSNLFMRNAHISYDILCDDLRKIAENTFIVTLYLLGGEPLLHERLIDYIEYSRKLLPYTEIEIVSNGLLIIKQSEEFFRCCRENDVVISISGYQPTLAVKDKIIEVLENNRVNYIFRQEILSFGKNIDLQGKADPETAHLKCRESSCHFFRKGKLYKCPFEALGNYLFDRYNVDIRLEGGVDIYDTALKWDNVVKKLDTESIDACRYCGDEEQIEWKIENHPE